MRNRLWILLVCIHCLGLAASAQSPAKQLILQISNGGFVAFRSETSAPGSKTLPDDQALAALLNSQAFAGENRIIHRVLTDAQQNVVFGYDLWISADPVTKKFSVAVLPSDEAFRRSFLKDSPLQANAAFATFPKSTTPQTLDDGDAVSLELLVNKESGVKIVDVVSVTFDRSRLRDGNFESAPKDFTLDAVALAVKNYNLSINGTLVSKSKSSIGCSGALLWFYVPERGRFIFSLVPREGYQFEKIAVLNENKIEFTVNGERYEWLSGEPILPSGGSWYLWVLHDTNYTPLFGSETPVPKTAIKKGPGVLEKLEGIMTGQGAVLTINGSPLWSKSNQKTVVPQRVMIGGADSMDNLLPKSP
jgi:hypothetical protein